MKASGGKSTLQLAQSEEGATLLLQRAGAKLPLLLHVGVVMLSQTVSGTMSMHWRGTLRTWMGTAWILFQEEATLEAVVEVSDVSEVSEVLEAVAASATKGRGVHRPSALGSESLPSVVGAAVEGAEEIRQQISR